MPPFIPNYPAARATSLEDCFDHLSKADLFHGARYIEEAVAPLDRSRLRFQIGQTAFVMGRPYSSVRAYGQAAIRGYCLERVDHDSAVSAWKDFTSRKGSL